MGSEHHFEVTRDFDGLRLDAALAVIFPDLGLRARRALWHRMDIRVQGRSCPPAFKVRAGQIVDVTPRSDVGKRKTAVTGIRVVAESSLFAALFKPARVHSVRGKSPGSVEEALTNLFPGECPVLLNRLDYLTSGLVLVGRSPDARARYLELQESGKVLKTYLALVDGQADHEICIKRAIDSAKRNKVRVLSADNSDPIRHTMVTPLGRIGKHTLVRAAIRKGQRHQIRAHLAACCYPIVGDPLYGKPGVQGDNAITMFLHHLDVRMPHFHAFCLPNWHVDVRGFLHQNV
ncbi:pseudouridine synthase family protein [Desulfoplanes formicivorans]|uniref:Pseudouridine synthase n=1 Tax=Desulfoplanes formicivorans TaxID=1592317 RepID=A0A194AJ61_9BACT|nr:RNA pseudouridine synthase [Desulfoplanes formicivorans]GAU09101.1 pseudouridine synthase [Desulfoplanes formicivorans]